MKKSLISAIACLLLLTGCDTVDEMLGSGDLDYSRFSTTVSDPSGSIAEDFEGDTITFTAFVFTEESFPMESEGKTIEGQKYIGVNISRNINNYIYINVEDMKEIPGYGDFVTIKGKVDGYIYYTNEDGKSEVLNSIASEITASKEKEVKVNKSDTYKSIDGDYKATFKRAQVVQDIRGENVQVIYYDYEVIENVVCASTDEIFVYQGEALLKSPFMIFSDGILDSSAIKSTISLNKSEKAYVYYPFSRLVDTSLPITIEAYDDDFNLVYEYTLSIT